MERRYVPRQAAWGINKEPPPENAPAAAAVA